MNRMTWFCRKIRQFAEKRKKANKTKCKGNVANKARSDTSIFIRSSSDVQPKCNQNRRWLNSRFVPAGVNGMQFYVDQYINPANVSRIVFRCRRADVEMEHRSFCEFTFYRRDVDSNFGILFVMKRLHDVTNVESVCCFRLTKRH